MQMLRTIGVLVTFAFLFVGVSPVFSGAKCRDDKALCVGLVTDVGVIDDKSFNQSAWEGVQKAAESLGAAIKYIETRDAKDYMSNIALFAENGYDVIITVGFALGEATVTSAKKYPDICFVGIDQFQTEKTRNVAGLVFNEDQSGFMAGALASMLSQSNVIAAVLATDMIPPVVAFKNGYEKGARYIKPDIRIIATYHPGGLDVAFTDPEWGASTAKQALAQGADVIFGAGGLTGNGALMETAAHKDRYCIGVDTDQWQTVPGARPCLVSSAMKFIGPSVYDLIKMASENRFPTGNYYGDVGLSDFHDFNRKLPETIKKQLTEIQQKLVSGKIK